MVRFYFEGIRKDTTLRKSDMYDYIFVVGYVRKTVAA